MFSAKQGFTIQGPAINYWFGTYGDTGISSLTSWGPALLDSAGNTILVGHGNSRSCIFKIDTKGAVIWAYRYSYTPTPQNENICLDSSDNLYICGGNSSNKSAYITKINSAGTVQWSRQIIDPANIATPRFYGITVDSTGNVYACGGIQAISPSRSAYLLVKYDSSGNLLWQQITSLVAGGNTLYLNNIVADSSNNLYAIGVGSTAGILMKFNTSGTLIWQKETTNANYFYEGISTDSVGNIYVLGGTFTVPTGTCILLKYNNSGSIVWQRNLSGTGNQYGRAITIDPSNKIYLSSSLGTGIFVFQYDTSGVLSSTQINLASNIGLVNPNKISIDAQNSIFIPMQPGYTEPTSKQFGLIIKIPNNGSLQGVYPIANYTKNITYTTVNYTDSLGSDTDTTPTFVFATSSYTSSSVTITRVNSTVTRYLTNL